MKFLDLNGLNHFLTKIKASFGTAIVNNYDYRNELDNEGHTSIPFVTNHQIVRMGYSRNINVYNWFQNASKGGILEIVFAGAQGGNTYCTNKDNVSFIYQMGMSSHGPLLNKINVLKTVYNTYTRLIKTDDDKLVVVEFVQNQ
jgi:hypothetical protein